MGRPVSGLAGETRKSASHAETGTRSPCASGLPARRTRARTHDARARDRIRCAGARRGLRTDQRQPGTAQACSASSPHPPSPSPCPPPFPKRTLMFIGPSRAGRRRAAPRVAAPPPHSPISPLPDHPPSPHTPAPVRACRRRRPRPARGARGNGQWKCRPRPISKCNYLWTL